MNWRKYLSRDVLVSLALGLITLILYSPMRNHGFIDFDDPPYVTDNPQVLHGLTLDGIIWSFTHFHSGNWHPLTWISLMLDQQIYGLNPVGYHATSLLIHLANSLLLFSVWRRMTGAFWRSAAVAALFAWHPVHVESVAWIAERKDVLSGLFWILTMWAYVAYVQTGRKKSYWLALAFFVAGLMSKPMLVTLPFALLLLDYWPLNRLQLRPAPQQPVNRRSLKQLIWEKWPFFALLPISSIVTFLAQSSTEAVQSLQGEPVSLRLATAVVGYAGYVEKMVWPANLIVFYPHPAHWPAETLILSLILLAVISALALVGWQRRPWLLTGWLWYLGTLVPVIGLVQVGLQSMADRYTYLPSIGLFAAVVWTGAELVSLARLPRWIGLATAGIALAACLRLTSVQVCYWRDSRALFSHALHIAGDNVIALTNLGVAAIAEHRFAEGRGYLEAALRLNPKDYYTWNALGMSSEKMGNDRQALEEYGQSLSLKPDQARTHFLAAQVLARLGRDREALAEYEAAMRLKPDVSDGWYLLGNLQARLNDYPKAISCYLKSLELSPDQADVHQNLAIALDAVGRMDDAASQFSIALELQPDLAEAHLGYGLLLTRQGKFDDAIKHFQEATRLRPDDSKGFFNLGLTLVSQHRGAAAVASLRSAVRLRPDWPAALGMLAWVLATDEQDRVRNGPDALKLAERAVELGGTNNPIVLDALAAAQAETGHFDQAAATAEKALAVARSGNLADLANNIVMRSQFYRSGKPWREPSTK